MCDIMDSRFYGRRTLLVNICWIFAFFHVGVNSQPELKFDGSGLLNSAVNFTCIINKGGFYGTFSKDEKMIAVIPKSAGDEIQMGESYINRTTTARAQLSSDGSYVYSIRLDKLQCSDEGNYSCETSMGVEIKKTSIPFHIKSSPQKPSLTAPSTYVVLGDTVTLQCTANVGKPPQNLSLCVLQEKGLNCSQVSTLVDLGNCSSTRTAMMTVNITEDTKRATCDVLMTDLSDSKTWEVYYPVLDIKFVPVNSMISLSEGESKRITCEARGNPKPSYVWRFRTKDAPADDPGILKLKGQVLDLTNVGLGDTGIYSCIATNEIRNITYNKTESVTINVVPTTPAPTTTIPTTPMKPTDGSTPKSGPQTNEPDDDWKLIVGIIAAILFLIILIALLVILYRRRSKPAEIEEPPEKPRNNHEVNMKETKPDLVYSIGNEKGKLPMYNTGFDHQGEDDLYYAELAFDDKPRSRKPVVPLYDKFSNNEPYTTVMPQV